MYSADELSQIEFSYLKNCVWLIIPENRPVIKSTLGSTTSLQSLIDEEKYVQIKTAEYRYGDYNCQIFQFACVTCSIHFERAITQSMCAKLMTQTVSHELRNPLNSIIMQQDSQHVYMKEMKKILGDENSMAHDLIKCREKIKVIFDEMLESCKISKTSSKLMLYNVEDLLDYGQMESGNFRKNIQQFDVKKAIQEIINVQLYKSSDKNIDLFLQSREFIDGRSKKDGEPDNFKIISDSQRLQQIILNLVSNALKFTPYGGYIKVDLELNRNSKVTSEGYIKIEVEDNGVGISKSNQKKLFKLFGFLNDTKEMNQKGIGLGLAISKKIINEFGGDIKVRSEINEGSTFIFSLKLEDEKQFFQDNIVLNFDTDSEEEIIDKVEKSRWQLPPKGKDLNLSEGTEIAQEDAMGLNLEPTEMIRIQGEEYKQSSQIGRMESGVTASNANKKPDFEVPEVNKGTAYQLQQFDELNNLPRARPSMINDFDFGVPPSIIIADDDFLNRLALRTLIKLCNVDALALTFLCEDGAQTVDACKSFDVSNFKLIFMDINMPKMDGLEASRAIKDYFKQKGATPPIIIGLTGDVDKETIKKGLNAGMDQVYSKPIKKNQVLQLLKELKFI